MILVDVEVLSPNSSSSDATGPAYVICVEITLSCYVFIKSTNNRYVSEFINKHIGRHSYMGE